MGAGAKDLDYLVARLHGRRSRLAEAERLDELCRLRSIPELASVLYPEREFQRVEGLQQRVVEDSAAELSELFEQLTGAGARLLGWMLARFQLENLKVLLRGWLTRRPEAVVERHLLALPKALELNPRELAAAKSLEQFIRLLLKGPLREGLEEGVARYGQEEKPFFLEAALDRGYFRELLARLAKVTDEHQESIQALVFQEVDIFHLMLVSRGKFLYRLTSELLGPLHLAGTRVSRARFVAMLAEPELDAVASRAVGHVVDALPPGRVGAPEDQAAVETASLEALAWQRYWRLANGAFRRSHLGLGAVVGYVGIRRVEVANLITLSEGIRAGLGVEALRARLVPRRELEVVHV